MLAKNFMIEEMKSIIHYRNETIQNGQWIDKLPIFRMNWDSGNF